jgi:hypothetical protein
MDCWVRGRGKSSHVPSEVSAAFPPRSTNIAHKQITPDVVVMEMHGRITMGSDSQTIEWVMGPR